MRLSKRIKRLKIFRKNKLKKRNVLISVFVVVFLFFLSVGVAYLRENLMVSGEIAVANADYVVITNISAVGENGGYETFNATKLDTTFVSSSTLPNANSTVTYEITFANLSNKIYRVSDIVETNFNNTAGEYVFGGFKHYDVIHPNETKTATVIVRYESTLPTNTEVGVSLNYLFEEYVIPPSNPPVITMNNVIYWVKGNNFTFAKYHAYDIVDGDISHLVMVDTSSLNINAVGTYDVVFSVTNSALVTANKNVTVNIVEREPTIYAYSGMQQEITIDHDGYYKLETWGASAGNGGAGGYSRGIVYLTVGTKLYLSVGGVGNYINGVVAEAEGGFNGGGKAHLLNAAYNVSSGGGASDIRILGTSLYNRFIVAGGGGGTFASGNYFEGIGGAGGGINGISGTTASADYFLAGQGGSQVSDDTSEEIFGSYTVPGTFGYGAEDTINTSLVGKPGGGGGWYGGGGSVHAGAGGGSGFIYTPDSILPTGYLVNDLYYLNNAVTLAGNENVPGKNGNGFSVGSVGDGQINITLIGSSANIDDGTGSGDTPIEDPLINPILDPKMIAVTFNQTSSKWEKASIDNWYDYVTYKWANAVVVSDYSKYSDVTSGTEILESDIVAYFVWIPRFEYKYTNLGASYAGGTRTSPGAIEINFISRSTVIPSSNHFKIHPAFNYNGTEKYGFWAGKFETTGNDAYPTIKPSLASYRGGNVNAFFNASKKIAVNSSLASESRIIRNVEWGAITYLTHSIYGRCSSATSCSEVAKQGNASYLTGGVGYVSVINQSTTNNVYGIYDMHGGAWEYVMGNFNSTIRNSGFSTMPEQRYYNLYTSTNSATLCNGNVCYGDGYNETAGWFNDMGTNYLNATAPWTVRGGSKDDNNGGIFSFDRTGGDANNRWGFRISMNTD